MVTTKVPTLIRSIAPQLEMLKELNFFKEKELKGIKSYREYYERTLSRDCTTCEDIAGYVKYELDLMTVVRGKTVDESLLEKKIIVLYCSKSLIDKLFAILTGHYPKVLQFWLLYIKFCQGMKDTTTLFTVLEQLVKIHKDKPWTFRLACRIAREDLKSDDKAREYIRAGIRAYMESELVSEMFKEAFLLELLLAQEKNESLTKGDEVQRKEPLTELMGYVYDAARVRVHKVDFFLELFHIVREHTFAKNLETRIQEDLLKLFPCEEAMWDTMAKIKLEQLTVTSNQPIFRNIIEEVVGIYKTAIEKHANTPTMWSMYIDTVLGIYNDASVDLYKFKKNCVSMAFTAAFHKNQLNEKHYIIWAELQKDDERKLQLLKEGTAKLPTSVPLWTKMITTRLAMNNETDAWRVFQDSLVNFRNDAPASLSLWKVMVRYYQSVRPDKVSWCFEEGLKDSCVSADMKAMYLEWMALTRGILACRELYSQISCSQPYSVPMHEKMIELENCQASLNIKFLRKVHALMTEQFGTQNVSVWMKWLNFENDVVKAYKNVSQIKDRAMKVLKPDLMKDFNFEMKLFEITCLAAGKPFGEVNNKRKATSAKNDGNKRKKIRV